MPSSHLILCHPLLLLPPVPPSIRVFSSESTLRMSWPKYWSFSFSIIPSKEIPDLISFRMDWLDLLAVQGTLKSLLQHHSSKAPILWRSAFFTCIDKCPQILQVSNYLFFKYSSGTILFSPSQIPDMHMFVCSMIRILLHCISFCFSGWLISTDGSSSSLNPFKSALDSL